MLLFNQGGPTETRDLWMLPLGGSPRPLLKTQFGERNAAIAPDGKWMVFVSTDAGRDDVYVASFPEPGARVPVSTSGGWQPVWSRDGKELYFRQGDWMMVAPVQAAPFRIGVPRQLFLFERALYGADPNVPDYDVGPDGRFVAVRASGAQSEIRVIVNWDGELKRSGPTN
jgi:hypothetical protein